MSKRTPGPWKIEAGGNTTIYGKDDIGVIGGGAFARRTHPEAWANLRLAAAAPELLDALAQLVGCIDHGSHDPSSALEAARAAIAKAVGHE